MSVLDNATIGALLRHPNAADARAKARDVLQRVGLGAVVDAPARSLGTPGRKRLEIARALASEPKALLLDEAMAGLTPTEVRDAIDLVRRIHGGGITIVIVEHIMEVITSLTRRVVVFHQGREIARGTPREVTIDPSRDEVVRSGREKAIPEGPPPPDTPLASSISRRSSRLPASVLRSQATLRLFALRKMK